MRRRSVVDLPTRLMPLPVKPPKKDVFRPRARIEIVPVGGNGFLTCADALTFSQTLQPGKADVVFLDPPFNLGKNYGVARWLEEGRVGRVGHGADRAVLVAGNLDRRADDRVPHQSPGRALVPE